MKKLIVITLLAASTVAHAGVVFYTENNGGGELALTDEKAGCKDDMQYLYSTDNNGKVVLTGCWVYREPFVHVEYSNGARRNYSARAFTGSQYLKDTYHVQ